MSRSIYLPRPLVVVPLLCIFIAPSAKSQDRAQLQTRIAALREEIQAKEKVFLAASADDLTAFAQFLRQPDTGIEEEDLPSSVYQLQHV